MQGEGSRQGAQILIAGCWSVLAPAVSCLQASGINAGNEDWGNQLGQVIEVRVSPARFLGHPATLQHPPCPAHRRLLAQPKVDMPEWL